MSFEVVMLVIGGVLVWMALAGSVIKRLPLSTSMLYLGVGVALGPEVTGLLDLDFQRHNAIVHRVSELGVLVSLFTAGMKMRVNVTDSRWGLPLRLATVSMLLTVAVVTALGTMLLELPLGAAVLLGAVLAPTDPVLASDVQLGHPGDRDRLRFALTGEAGLNDGTAFPFVMLGLGLLALHPLGPSGVRWFGVDLLWATTAGLGIGALCGHGVGHLVLYLRKHHREAVGLDEFLALGLIAVAYSVTALVHAYGFLAVFAAGYSLRRVERRVSGQGSFQELGSGESAELATHPEHAPAYLAQRVLGFDEQLERIAEVALVVTLGALLRPEYLSLRVFAFVALLLLVVRPLATAIGLWRAPSSGVQKVLIAWFGIRGIGSIYYLAFAIEHGVSAPLAQPLIGCVLVTIATSVVVHGVSVTPLMKRYADRHERPTAEPTATAQP